MSGILGTPDEVIEGLSTYAAAGVEEVMVQWFGVADTEGLAALADQVLPHFRS
jgi:alkanesulfonate monooxygenase SsuD/methylene tetrahydromethanopterin reductase-like flavin-dependent oxidoreductase (luciferase family)